LRIKKNVDGVLLLDKPEGLSSNAALQKVRRLFAAKKAGHTGTLDPLASGLLPLCLGEATKFSADLLHADKTYRAEVALGVSTTTGDREGDILETRPVSCAPQDVLALLPRFTGTIRQVPPMYSALKRDGQPLYALARQGVTVERAAREVRIHRLELLASDFAAVPPRLTLEVHCGKGTYIRTLAEDLGRALGCGAHLLALRRTAVGALTLAGAHSLAGLESLEESALAACLCPVDSLLSSLTAVHLEAAASERFSHGNPVDPEVAQGEGDEMRVYGPSGYLLGTGRIREGRLWPKRLLAGGENDREP
jgi:tRNA pseudouridine55 synthase